MVRFVGYWFLNVMVALFATSVVEPPFWRLMHERTIEGIEIKELLLSAILATLLGFLVYRRWRPESAKWVAVGGIFWFAMIVCLAVVQGGGWTQMSGIGCDDGPSAYNCSYIFIYSVFAARTIFYSAGAWICSCFSNNGPLLMGDALVGRFRCPSSSGQIRRSSS